ncbi:MAG: hypothetical protein OQK73_07875 [Gammaproteobacteria bacterium]|nr:hypothetical protein [Gammaproteobacteria bacterium]
METNYCQHLDDFLRQYHNEPQLQPLQVTLNKLKSDDVIQNLNQHQRQSQYNKLIQLYQQAIPAIEAVLATYKFNDSIVLAYQNICMEMECLYSDHIKDERHHFIVVIPVADRPQHLAACISSLFQLCVKFAYGGMRNSHYSKVMVIIADDSCKQESINENKRIAASFSQQGLTVEYFGINEQINQLENSFPGTSESVIDIVGNNPLNQFCHKGASITRNITYLRINEQLNEFKQTTNKLLFYFIDSDQEFKVKVRSDGPPKDVFAINYFYHLDNIFSESDVDILTGKVVGDPPVSPAVMTANFLDDVTGFLSTIAEYSPVQACQFHSDMVRDTSEAVYHDMADLFGFKPTDEKFKYQCGVTGKHDHRQCFLQFASNLSRFFDGEHPTRQTYYEPEELKATIKSARTIYTGNYIFNPDGLKYFIPFASLKLRMAGPVLGRLIKSELGERFVSANLPMLHKRTVAEMGQSEFRSGVNRTQHQIDLSSEYERQFFGDVMLFTIEKLTDANFPKSVLSEEYIESIIIETESSLLQKYRDKRHQILNKIELFKDIFYDERQWWNTVDSLVQARSDFDAFITNIELNFGEGSKGYSLINSDAHRVKRRHEILSAILAYKQDRVVWEKVISGQVSI